MCIEKVACVDSESSVIISAHYKSPGQMYSDCINFIGSVFMFEMNCSIVVKECILWQ